MTRRAPSATAARARALTGALALALALAGCASPSEPTEPGASPPPTPMAEFFPPD